MLEVRHVPVSAVSPSARRSPLVTRAAAVTLWLVAIAVLVVSLGRDDVLYLPFLATPGFGTAGLILAYHRPRSGIGWLLLALAVLPGSFGLATLAPELINGTAILLVAAFLLVFPTGWPPSTRWWLLAGTVAVGWAVIPLTSVGLPGARFSVSVGLVASLAAVAGCCAAPVVRIRRAGPVERAQLRWFGFAASTTAVLAAATLVLTVFFGPEGVAPGALGLSAAVSFTLGIPAAVTIAVTRHRLYEIDKVVSRTLTYVVVASILAAVFAIPVLLFAGLAGGSGNGVVAAATLGAAALFRPLHRTVRRRVDRRFNRSSYAMDLEMASFAERLRRSYDTTEVIADLTGVTGRTLQPRSLGVWIRSE